jgi:hypothetical protein
MCLHYAMCLCLYLCHVSMPRAYVYAMCLCYRHRQVA